MKSPELELALHGWIHQHSKVLTEELASLQVSDSGPAETAFNRIPLKASDFEEYFNGLHY